ncbi:hypothetical protein CXB51_014904 [Gossypium anomalum]|uniref:Uncharacterized protein n=1 Tax=Gossypium anomalum TaxID=47600 RepID=A0A8J5ZLR2_9ROSI|nr:hypothetical protein CXB51_014904 [Gossypium anomalum]
MPMLYFSEGGRKDKTYYWLYDVSSRYGVLSSRFISFDYSCLFESIVVFSIRIDYSSSPRAHIDGKVWHLDVGSSPPGAVVCSKGWAVRPLKRYVSWVQNVVRQFGPYPVWALEH